MAQGHRAASDRRPALAGDPDPAPGDPHRDPDVNRPVPACPRLNMTTDVVTVDQMTPFEWSAGPDSFGRVITSRC